MAIDKHALSRLPSKEIASLYAATRKAYIEERDGQEREAQDRPQNSSGGGIHFADGSWCTCEGGAASHSGPDERYVISESGAMIKLGPNEERPASLEDERTERLIRMPQNEVDRLSDDARAELTEFRNAVLEQRAQAFRAARPKYYDVDENFRAMLDRLGKENLGYCMDDTDEMMDLLLTRGAWSVENLCSAFDDLWTEGKMQPRPGDMRRLDADELRTLSAYCAGCQTDSEFERVLDQYVYLASGNAKGWRAAALDSRYSKVLQEAVFFCFENSQPDYSPTPERRRFLKKYLASRFPSIRLLRAAWIACQKAEEKGELEQNETPAPRLSEDQQNLNQAQELANQIARATWEGI